MRLTLVNGMSFEGESFGAPVSTSGEVVFNTGMVGYVEGFTDPSYAGQIVVATYPLVGNYGVPERRFFESEKIQIAGLVVSEYSEQYSHYRAKQSLANWLKISKVPAITGVDTRAITKILREKGVMLGQLTHSGKPRALHNPNDEHLVARVSIKRKKTYGSGAMRILLVDCGAKENIIRSLVSRGVTVIRVPWDYDFSKERYDGLLISNGPGDPTMCGETIQNVAKAYKRKKPILGICLGIQIMALAAGGKTYKLKYGHRSQNQPAIDVTNNAKRCYITSQNHGYAVDAESLPKEWQVWMKNGNDASLEGMRHAKLPYSAVQFHPEASPGPTDTAWIFDEFIKTVEHSKKRK